MPPLKDKPENTRSKDNHRKTEIQITAIHTVLPIELSVTAHRYIGHRSPSPGGSLCVSLILLIDRYMTHASDGLQFDS